MLRYSQGDIGRVSVVTPATVLPLTVAQIKKHLRIDHNEEDDELGDWLATAIGEIEHPNGWLGRSLMPQRLKLTFDAPPPRVIALPGPPVTEVKTIKTRGADDTITTIYNADLAIDTIGLITDYDAEPALIWPDDDIGWPSDIKTGPDSMQIEYLAGYADAASLPGPIRSWLYVRIGELYRDRERSMLNATSTRLSHVDRMLDNLRIRS